MGERLAEVGGGRTGIFTPPSVGLSPDFQSRGGAIGEPQHATNIGKKLGIKYQQFRDRIRSMYLCIFFKGEDLPASWFPSFDMQGIGAASRLGGGMARHPKRDVTRETNFVAARILGRCSFKRYRSMSGDTGIIRTLADARICGYECAGMNIQENLKSKR